MERIKRGKKEVLGGSRSAGGHCRSWLGIGLVVIATCCLVACTTLKKAGIVSLGAGGGALAGTVLSGGAAAPILGATTTAFVTDVVTEAIPIGKRGKKNMSECVQPNFWSLLGQIVETGGWFLLLLIVLPMVMGWILPGPLEKKKKKR